MAIPDLFRDLLNEEASRRSLQLGKEALEKILCYLDLIAKWGKSINLTANLDTSMIIYRHLCDSFVYLVSLDDLFGEGVRSKSKPSFADVGAGAGFLGILVSILSPNRKVSLVEPRHKRVAFLRTVIQELALEADVLDCGLSEVPPSLFDFAASRATWKPATWLESGTRILKPGGLISCFLGKPDKIPVSEGLTPISEVKYVLADGRHRQIITFRRCFT